MLIQNSTTQAVGAATTNNIAAATTINDTALFQDSLIKQQQLQHADYVSGRLGISLNKEGVPASVVYFNSDGTPATRSAFNAEQILRNAEKFAIPLSDLSGLGEQLSTDKVGYLPHQLYPGSSSDHGIDFKDLINGGMGTAYNWGVDANAALKGSSSIAQLADTQAFIQRLGLTAPGSTAAVVDNKTTAEPVIEKAVATEIAAPKVAADEPIASTALQLQQKQQADYVSGRLGISLNQEGVPASVVYFNSDGTPATRSAFNAEQILRYTEEFDIPLTDLASLGEQLTADEVGYLPHQLYANSGSDHGIDFNDLISGGMGTAYNWGVDANVALKGPAAATQLADAQALIERRGLTYNATLSQPAATLSTQQTAATDSRPSTNNSMASESLINPQDLQALQTTLRDLNLQKNPEIAAHLQTLLDLVGQNSV